METSMDAQHRTDSTRRSAWPSRGAWRRRWLLAVVAALAPILIARGGGEEGGAPAEESAAPEAGDDDGIRVIEDEESGVVRILLPAPGGRVEWGDVLRALARLKGFEDDALSGFLSEKGFSIRGRRGRWKLLGLSIALAPHLQLARRRAESGDPGDFVLEVRIDRLALLATSRRLKALVRGALEKRLRRGVRGSREPRGLELDDGWDDTPSARGLVVAVHGLGSSAEVFDELLPHVREFGRPCGTFDYPNDQPIADAARLLSRELREVARRDPDRRVTLLTHSMGGLVAREAVENHALDPGNVGDLVLVAPPNHGSVLAHFGFGLEVWEFIKRRDERDGVERIFAVIEDGLGEAYGDLQPGSPFLRQLNERERNPRVRYTIFLGTGGPLTEQGLGRLRERIRERGRRSRFVRFIGPKVDEHLADLKEVVRGKGDAAVAVKRGRLEGVDDIRVLDFHHVGVWKKSAALREALLERLAVEVERER